MVMSSSVDHRRGKTDEKKEESSKEIFQHFLFLAEE